MAKMRATLRKVAQVTPPPSPKNGDDVKGHSEWSTRLRNHSIPAVVKIANGRRAKIVRIKKENPVFHHNGDFNCSRSSTPSPVCDASRTRMRQMSGEGLNYWPRRSARLIGIPAEEIEDQHNKSNGSIDIDKEDPEEEDESVCDQNDDDERLAPEEPQCKNCKQQTNKQQTNKQQTNKQQTNKQQTNKQQTKGRTVEPLLVENQRFMHYPSARGTCRNSRSTFNSRDIRPPVQTSARIVTEETQHESATTPLPMIQDRPTVDQVQFSFEIVPSGTSWYQTFLRDEECHRESSAPLLDDPPIGPAPFLLPYEMSLETILKSNRAVRKNNIGRGRGAKKAVALSFRPIISTRLQMQSAARQSQLAAAASSSKASALNKNDGRCLRPNRRKPWFNMPRKSPRCHASTMAILCSKSDTESDAVTSTSTGTTTTKTRAVVEESQVPQEEVKKALPAPDSYLVQVLEEMLTQGLEKRTVNPVRKRGRPRKRPLPPDQQCPLPTELVESSIANLLATPLERIEDIVDERMLLPDEGDHCMFNDPVYPPFCWTTDHRQDNPSLKTGLDQEMFPDLDSHSGSRSSSVYETASEMGSTSTSTGTCDSRRKVWRNAGGLRRKRRCNMTGWPRSKKRRPLQLSIINVAEDLNLTGNLSCDDDDDEGPPNIILSPIREESSLLVDSPNASQQQPSPSSSGANKSFVSKPFQFQRKTLRFVGKRILRPAAQRHAPQRLEYWPCFPTEASRRRKRKT